MPYKVDHNAVRVIPPSQTNFLVNLVLVELIVQSRLSTHYYTPTATTSLRLRQHWLFRERIWPKGRIFCEIGGEILRVIDRV